MICRRYLAGSGTGNEPLFACQSSYSHLTRGTIAWSSTTAQGDCSNPERERCAWRVKRVAKTVNASCVNGNFLKAVPTRLKVFMSCMAFLSVSLCLSLCLCVAYAVLSPEQVASKAAPCLANCSPIDRANTTSDCFVTCIFQRMLGKSTSFPNLTHAAMTPAELVAPWIQGFETEDVTKGGCPAIKHDDGESTVQRKGGAAVGVRLLPCGGKANAAGLQNWTVTTDASGLIGLAGADLWLALSSPGDSTDQPLVGLTRNRSAALVFEFLPAGRGQRGAEVWIRTSEPVSAAGELLCLDDFASAPHHPSHLPTGGIFLGGCDDMSGAETWVAAGSEHWSTRNKPKWLVCGSTDDEQCLTAAAP